MTVTLRQFTKEMKTIAKDNDWPLNGLPGNNKKMRECLNQLRGASSRMDISIDLKHKQNGGWMIAITIP